MNELKIFSIAWSSKTAGPSPDGTRTELFLMGCQKAASGNPCKGCFNPDLWADRAEKTHKPVDVAEQIEKFASNKFITIVGGEPTDQMEGLTELCVLLKAKGFHIIVFSWRKLETLLFSGDFPEAAKLMENIDVLIDGEFIAEDKIYDEGIDCIIGSGNQTIWDLHQGNLTGLGYEGVSAGDVFQMAISPDKVLHLLTVENAHVRTVVRPEEKVVCKWPAA